MILIYKMFKTRQKPINSVRSQDGGDTGEGGKE